MFEPLIRALDSTQGMWVGAASGLTNVAAQMAQQGAKEGHDYAGPGGAMMMGAVGWAYGSVIGLMMGAMHGSIVGAKHYMEKPSEALVPAQDVTPHQPVTPPPPVVPHQPKTPKTT